MEVILQKDVDRLGKAFEVKSVKDGYAINFLLPQKLAVIATEGKKKRIEQDRKAFERKEAARVKDASATAKKLEELSLTITMKAGEEEKLYGSVTSQVIAENSEFDSFEVQFDRLDLRGHATDLRGHATDLAAHHRELRLVPYKLRVAVHIEYI